MSADFTGLRGWRGLPPPLHSLPRSRAPNLPAEVQVQWVATAAPHVTCSRRYAVPAWGSPQRHPSVMEPDGGTRQPVPQAPCCPSRSSLPTPPLACRCSVRGNGTTRSDCEQPFARFGADSVRGRGDVGRGTGCCAPDPSARGSRDLAKSLHRDHSHPPPEAGPLCCSRSCSHARVFSDLLRVAKFCSLLRTDPGGDVTITPNAQV